MNEKIRSEFEARFPVPNGVTWSDGAYHLVKEKSCTKLSHLFYLGRWESWQASRQAIEIELPVARSPHNIEVIKAVGRHIVAQGLKVKP